jgi:hypothetical protein
MTVYVEKTGVAQRNKYFSLNIGFGLSQRKLYNILPYNSQTYQQSPPINKDFFSVVAQISKLGALVSELQQRINKQDSNTRTKSDHDSETLAELRSALEAEKAGATRLEQALAAALADNATLAAIVHSNDNTSENTVPKSTFTSEPVSSSICAIDSFLAE